MRKLLLFIILNVILAGTATAQGVCDTITMADTLHLCAGGTGIISATATTHDTLLSLRWSPAAGLSDTTILNPLVSLTASGYYYLTLTGLIPANLIANGDFSAGNTGFSSAYTYVAPSSASVLYPEGLYTVATNPVSVHSGAVSFGDHTTGTGSMMIVNGSSSSIYVWCQTIAVTPYTDYQFSAWMANWNPGVTAASAPIIQFEINGTTVGPVDTLLTAASVWNNFFVTWNSGAATTAAICIKDLCTATGGNDFVLDDITFRQICKSKDSIYVSLDPIDTITSSKSVTDCPPAGSITLTAPGGYSTYLWSNGSTASTLTVTTSGTYYVYCTRNCTTLIDSTRVTINPYVVTSAITDTTFCFPGSLWLGAADGYTGYIWQDGTASPAFEVTAPGTYFVTCTRPCTSFTDSFRVTHANLSVDLGPDTTVCMNYNIVPTLLGDGASFVWQDGYTGTTYSTSHTGTYYTTVHQGNCIAADTVNVTFYHLTQNMADTFICKGTPINVTLDATPPPGGSVMWNDGITNPVRVVNDSGTWWVYIKKDECEKLDTVRIITGYCDCWYNMPDGFTPNNDGLNDLIKPTIQPGCTISGYEFTIFNRWGEQVFTTGMRGDGWNGMYKGTPADLGMYYYSLQFFIGVKDKPVVKSGSITLIR